MTPVQRRVLDEIIAAASLWDCPPSYRHLAELLGRKSAAGVYVIVQHLIRDGYLVKASGRPGYAFPEVDLRSVSTDQLQRELSHREGPYA